jgi:hypothetical protein
MKSFLLLSAILCASGVASAAAPGHAWCKAAAPGKVNLQDLSSKDVRVVLTAFVNALCAPTAEVEAHRAEIEQARQAWSQRLGLVEADWADVAVYVQTHDDFSIPVPVIAKTFAAASPLDQLAIIRGAEQGTDERYDTLYATDMFEANLSEVGRYAFLSGSCFDQTKSVATDGSGLIGSEVMWAICQPDFERFNLGKMFDEIRADTAHDGAARMKLRVAVYNWAKLVKDHAAQVSEMLGRDPANKQLFEAAAGARTAWAGSVGKHTRLLELVSAMESATRTQSRKQFEGCAETTAKELADAVSTLPAKLFAGMYDNLDNPWDAFAAKAGIPLGQSAPVNLAAIAYTLCTPESPVSTYLTQILTFAPTMRGPRSAALGRLRDEKIQYDNAKAQLWFPRPRPYGDMYPQQPVHALSYGGVVRAVKREGELLTVERQQVMVSQPQCLKFHYTGRVTRIRDNGSVEYDRVCDQMGSTSVNHASTPLRVQARFAPLLKPGVMISTTGDEVIATWASKTAKQPTTILGGTLK